MEYITHSPAETEELGCRLGRTLRPGTVVAYFGGLGMGKTAFTRGLAQGLGCRGRVTSPTFTIVNEYDGPTPLFHFDMYRLPDADGRIIWTGAACAPWSGVKTSGTLCRWTPSPSPLPAVRKMTAGGPSPLKEGKHCEDLSH